MSEPAIISVAITGAIPRKENNPAVPVTPSEQIESTHEAFEAGAALVHIHVRDDEQKQCCDIERYGAVQEGVRAHCPGMIIQFSCGASGFSAEERARSLALRPDMGSLATGSVNFANRTYANPPDLVETLARTMRDNLVKPEVEVFDLAMLYNARALIARGLIEPPAHVQFVLGIPNALPAEEAVLDLLIAERGRILPDATWSCLGIGRHQLSVNRWALAKGGHLRTGLEDNIYRSKGVLAKSNGELVALAVEQFADYDRHPATPAEARRILGLRAA
jgi:uncharacterized protein (DUF849 family)